jgi:protein involved in polysaccharide export with SLBB domain
MRLREAVLIVSLVSLLISLTGCFSSRPEDIKAYLKPADVVVSAGSYILHPPDEIEIHCSKVPTLHLQRQQIRPDGNITFESLGTVEAAGKTPEQLAEILRTKASSLYSLEGDNPIDVRIVTYRSKMFYVLGEVERPGPKIYTGRDTTLSAIAEANPTALAWNKRIQVVRPSSSKDSRPKIFELNFDRMIAHGDASKDVLLQEGDIIYVPPTILAAIGKTVQEVMTPISSTASTITVIQRAVVGPGSTQAGP